MPALESRVASLMRGHAMAGALFAAGFEAWPLVICAALKIAYDALLLRQFLHLKPPEGS